MSQIAELHLIDQINERELINSVNSRRFFFFGSRCNMLPKYLSSNAVRLSDYKHQGHYVLTLLLFLQDKLIDLLESKLDATAAELTQKSGSSVILISGTKSDQYFDVLKNSHFTEDAFSGFAENFYETKSAEHAIAMKSAFEWVLSGLEIVPNSGALVLIIG